MSILGSNMLAGAAGRARHEIERSLRFNANDSAHLTRTPSSASNSTTFTWSAWVKTNRSDSHETLFSATPSGDGTLQYDFILENDQLYVYGIETFFVYQKKLSRVFRDRSAWYHLVVAFDTTDSTAEDRIKIYVNGERQTDFATNSNPSASRTTGFNKTNEHSIGARTGYSGAQYFDGYQAEINFIDGSQLGPESFGQTDLETGAWIPRQYSGSYGTNGFYLKFADSSGVTATTLGKDSSGNGNNWTPNNFSVTAGAGNDSLFDTPTNNFCTANVLYAPSSFSLMDFANGNLDVGQAATNKNCSITATFPMSTGKWYWEVTNKGSQNFRCIGIQTVEATAWRGTGTVLYRSDGQKFIDGTNSLYGASYTTNDVLGFAYDADAGSLTVYKNNTSQGVIFSSGAGKTYLPCVHDDNAGSGVTYFHNLNFGQRAFAYTPPAGFQALNAKNLPTPTIHDGTKYFNTVLYTGNGSTQTISGVGFQPDWTWIKQRDGAENHFLTDSVRGAGIHLRTDQASAENDDSATFTAFTSDGFSLTGSGPAEPQINDNTESFVSWNWKKSVDAGFDIVTDVGTGVAKTVSHNLGVAPKMIIRKSRTSSSGHWYVYHYEEGASKAGIFQLTNAFATQTAWNSTEPTSSVFSVGSNVDENKLNDNYITYLFAEVEGYSKFGSYTGNGSTDGTFVTTNFQPAFVLVKRTDSVDSWQIHDTSRASYNPSDKYLLADSAGAEGTITTVDFLSNGFKLRNSSNLNNSGGSFVYMAFAETPFKYANAR